jgi:predicted Zn-dependent peptidase
VTSEVWPLVTRYFGRIPKGSLRAEEVVTQEPAQSGEKRFTASAETSPTLRVWWHAVPFVHKDRPAFVVLADLLSGRTGRLFKGLVLSRKVANTASAEMDAKKYAGIFEVEATVKEGSEPLAVEKAIDEEIASLQRTEVPPEELQKVQNETKANAYRRLASPFYIGLQLLWYDGLGDWREINRTSEATEAVTAADILRLARDYLTRENRTVGTFLRKEPPPGGHSGLEALPEGVRRMVEGGIAEIDKETDPKALRDGIGQLREREAHVPEDVRPAIEIMIHRAEERLLALEKAHP